MKIRVANPELGTLVWELPPLITEALKEAEPHLQQVALQWLERQAEGFVLAVTGSVADDRKRRNLQTAISELVLEVLVDNK